MTGKKERMDQGEGISDACGSILHRTRAAETTPNGERCKAAEMAMVL